MPNPPTTIAVVSAIILNANRILLGYRINTDRDPDHWGLPAGRVDPSELPSHALVREMREELNIRVDLPSEPEFIYDSAEGRRFAAYRVTQWRSEIINAEPHLCRELGWHPLDALPAPLTVASRELIGAFVGRG